MHLLPSSLQHPTTQTAPLTLYCSKAYKSEDEKDFAAAEAARREAIRNFIDAVLWCLWGLGLVVTCRPINATQDFEVCANP